MARDSLCMRVHFHWAMLGFCSVVWGGGQEKEMQCRKWGICGRELCVLNIAQKMYRGKHEETIVWIFEVSIGKESGDFGEEKKKKSRKRKNIDQVTGDAVMWPVRLPGSWPCLALVPQSSCPGYPGLCGSSCSPLLHTPPRGWVTA